MFARPPTTPEQQEEHTGAGVDGDQLVSKRLIPTTPYTNQPYMEVVAVTVCTVLAGEAEDVSYLKSPKCCDSKGVYKQTENQEEVPIPAVGVPVEVLYSEH